MLTARREVLLICNGISVPGCDRLNSHAELFIAMSTKDERKGFAVSQPTEPNPQLNHPAWETFKATYEPAEPGETTEYLTTLDVIERMNSIIDVGSYSEKETFERMKAAGFTHLSPPPAGVFYWMVKGKTPVL